MKTIMKFIHKLIRRQQFYKSLENNPIFKGLNPDKHEGMKRSLFHAEKNR